MSFTLNQSLAYLTTQVSNRFKAQIERGFAARGLDITADQWAVLYRLYQQDGLAQHELAERLLKDKTNVARILALMEERELIERRVDPEDNRARKAYLTTYGRSLVPELIVVAQEGLQHAQRGMTDAEVQALIKALNHLLDNLS